MDGGKFSIDLNQFDPSLKFLKVIRSSGVYVRNAHILHRIDKGKTIFGRGKLKKYIYFVLSRYFKVRDVRFLVTFLGVFQYYPLGGDERQFK